MSDRAWGLKAIARRLCVAEEETVLAYARRWRDPLRLHRRLGRYWMVASRIDAWRERQHAGNTCPRVRTLGAIGEKLGVGAKAIRRYATRAHDPLPVEWGAGGIWAYADALRDWYQAQDELVRVDPVASPHVRDKGLTSSRPRTSNPVPRPAQKG